MTLVSSISQKKAAITRKWCDRILDTYPGKSAAFFKREKNEFANPVGQTFAASAASIVDALVAGVELDELAPHLEKIVKIRSIQEFRPSEGLAFAFQLKDVIREELKSELKDDALQAELREFEGRLDRLSLLALDVFVACRDQFHEIRINEIKRSVSSLMRRDQRSRATSDRFVLRSPPPSEGALPSPVDSDPDEGPGGRPT